MPIHIPETDPVPAFVYVDWNVVQYLQQPEFGPMLEALHVAAESDACLIPFGPGHIFDATAGWTRLDAMSRGASFRNMVFFDGLGSGVLWTRRPREASDLFENIRFVAACRSRGSMSSIHDGEYPEILEEATRVVRASAAETAAAIRRNAADAPWIPEEVFEALARSVEELLADGLPELSDAGRNNSLMLATWLGHASRELPDLGGSVSHSAAVAAVERRLATVMPSFSLDQLIASHHPAHPDELGPAMLGHLGYRRDAARALRQGKPGPLADQAHGPNALASAIFFTGDARLHDRLAAWAHHTGRGETHNTWPILVLIKPNEENPGQEATDLLTEFTRRFAGRIDLRYPAE